MPQVVQFRQDRLIADRQVTQALRQGAVVSLPDETGGILAVNALDADAVRRLGSASADVTLALADRRALIDWVSDQGGPLGRRLARRLWPGAVELAFRVNEDASLFGRLPNGVRERMLRDGRVRFRVPEHPATAQMLGSVGVPVLTAPLTDAVSADVIVEHGSPTAASLPTVVEVDANAWRVVREGAVSSDDLARLAVCLIVFVCTGNTCRSPMAEALCKRMLADRLGCEPDDLPARGYRVMSAGLAAAHGEPASADAVEAVRELGGDLSQHRSRQAPPALIGEADHVLAVTRMHLQAIVERCRPTGAVRLVCADGEELSDPIGRDTSVYRECAGTIRRHLEGFMTEVLPS